LTHHPFIVFSFHTDKSSVKELWQSFVFLFTHGLLPAVHGLGHPPAELVCGPAHTGFILLFPA
jgi:hypothetical protein